MKNYNRFNNKSLILQHFRLFLIFKTFKWRQKTASKTGRFKTARKPIVKRVVKRRKNSFGTRLPMAFKKTREITNYFYWSNF